jgi:hypothetical protein
METQDEKIQAAWLYLEEAVVGRDLKKAMRAGIILRNTVAKYQPILPKIDPHLPIISM